MTGIPVIWGLGVWDVRARTRQTHVHEHTHMHTHARALAHTYNRRLSKTQVLREGLWWGRFDGDVMARVWLQWVHESNKSVRVWVRTQKCTSMHERAMYGVCMDSANCQCESMSVCARKWVYEWECVSAHLNNSFNESVTVWVRLYNVKVSLNVNVSVWEGCECYGCSAVSANMSAIKQVSKYERPWVSKCMRVNASVNVTLWVRMKVPKYCVRDQMCRCECECRHKCEVVSVSARMGLWVWAWVCEGEWQGRMRAEKCANVNGWDCVCKCECECVSVI